MEATDLEPEGDILMEGVSEEDLPYHQLAQ